MVIDPSRWRPVLITACLLVAWASPHHGAPGQGPGEVGGAGSDALDRVAALLIGEEMVSGGAYRKLAWLSDHIGPRLSGSPGAERAVAWALEEFRRDGLAKVRAEKVMVPRWVRGVETADIVSPVSQPMATTAIGMSVPTPPEGIIAEVIEVTSFDELHALGEKVRGRIVFYNKPIDPHPEGAGYGSAAGLRYSGASEAAKQGAVAMLIRSLGTLSARLPHTGAHAYQDGVERIPAAAVAAEDADLLHRLLTGGKRVKVNLTLGCKTFPDVESANVVAELRGRIRPQEIVVIGAHLDSWDLGTGAIDDGAGIAVTMEAMRLLRKQNRRPRRTIRAVLFMNEENGNRGGKTYARDHKAELGLHVAAIESDSGAGRPLGFSVNAGPGGEKAVRDLASRLTSIGATQVIAGGDGGVDISPMRAAGVPLLGLRQDMTHYFDWHHTAADTLDKVDPRELADNAAAMAYLAFALADLDTPLPRIPPENRKD